MAFVTGYHKGHVQAIDGTEQFIPLFLLEPVGKLLMAYLIFVVPSHSQILINIHVVKASMGRLTRLSRKPSRDNLGPPATYFPNA